MDVWIGTIRDDNGARMTEFLFCSSACRGDYERDFLEWDNTFAIVHTFAQKFTRDARGEDAQCEYCGRIVCLS